MTFGEDSTAAEVAAGHDLTGKAAVVTGGASGLGFHTAHALASAGARVALIGRDQTAGFAAAERIRTETGNAGVEFARVDLGSLASVRGWAGERAATGHPLHLLINNAAVMATPLTRTAEGFESQFGINHLGHFALAACLLPVLRAAGTARVVSLSSRAHRRADVDLDDPNYLVKPYAPWEAYGRSKTATSLFAVGASARWAGDGVTANAVMPGAIPTGLPRHLESAQLTALGRAGQNGAPATRPGWKTPEQGAATTVWAALAAELTGVGGLYLEDCAIATAWTGGGDLPTGHYLPYALDQERAGRLWELSEKLIAS
ncbi:SDR family NAD(P)-dependent oxidoreductase [Nonomuraea sp. NN258]|uniref:SDR family NAD(P)-dependent oxidoreductase n=1 Tax=Nonomuraea antri TaxID=2730852 RepID=UPI00156962D4|nr:SDR family NAD(P)-dependent oxidoreductase [Nonomuraea antri]NRQ39880.1 SDR family NAD(P)-dependent oxidoreductase [Nonomuraea antri]